MDTKNARRKQNLYFPETMLDEIQEEAARLKRPVSWVVQRTWDLAKLEIQRMRGTNDTRA